MKPGLLVLFALFLACFASVGFAADAVRVEHFTLKNGMEVVVIPNSRVPAVSHALWLRVGSADEPWGISGVAHYLEHMMFKGTKTLKVGEYSKIVSAHGGNHNAFTSYDFTGYYVNIAKEHLPLVMQMEADRMVNLQVDDAEFLKERAVIMEERSLRTDNVPAALLAEQMSAALFLNHPYQRPIIGWRNEMEALSREQVFSVYRRFYHPNNAVLVVAGDITAEELKPLAERFYGVLPAGEAAVRNWPQEPVHLAERRIILRDEKVQQPLFVRDYLAPGFKDKAHRADGFALSILAQILGGSETSRLYQALVVEQKIATSASVDYHGLTYGNAVFSISAEPAAGVGLAALERAVDKVLADFMQKGATEEELARAKTLSKSSIIYAQDGLQALGFIMGQLYVIGLDASFFNAWVANIDAVSAVQVIAAARVLDKKRSVSGWLLREEKANAS